MSKKINGKGLIDIVFSWSFEEVTNDDLMKAKVPIISDTFTSVSEYLTSFIPAFVEETRCQLSSGIACPSSDICLQLVSFVQHPNFSPPALLQYDAVFRSHSGTLKEDASTGLLYGDVIAFSHVVPTKPEHISTSYVIAVVVSFGGEDSDAIKLLTSKVFEFSKSDVLFAVRLGNLTTNMRIWEALMSAKDSPILSSVLKNDSPSHLCAFSDSLLPSSLLSNMATWKLNASQETVVMDGIKRSVCFDGLSVNLVWGPPGTGKTTVLGCLLFSLLKLRRRTLACAPTNVAVQEMSSRLLRHVSGPYGLGDVLLFGNQTRLKVEEDGGSESIFVDHRVDMLMNITNPCYGWRNRLESVISMLKSYMEECEYSDDETNKEEERRKRFIREKLLSSGSRLRFFLIQICTHLPTSFLSVEVAEDMMKAHDLLQQFDSLLREKSDEIESVSKQCVETLTRLPESFPFLRNDEFSIKKFCFENSCVLFSTVSGSAKLKDMYTKKNPIHMVIIDEAAQLRECESVIPMRIRGVRHAFLVGDEKQLEAVVQSEVSKRAYLGRSMFERLVKLGFKKHLLNVQYRMHPSISMFPVSEFYSNWISDGANVKMASYERGFLKGEWCGPYSFINVSCGKEEMELNSYRNMAEVAVIEDIVSRLYKGEMGEKENLSIGVISPYVAQVKAIERRIDKYSKGVIDVNVRSVDGFQGGEEDIIILSTVRKNAPGNLGFVTNERRTNVAITRARHCLWIIGNGPTLSRRKSVWKDIIKDAKSRNCFYDAGDDRGLSLAISFAAIEKGGETEEDSRAAKLFLKRARWHVKFDLDFGETMRKAKERGVLKEAMVQLQRLAYGWRPSEETSKKGSRMVNRCRVADHTVILWTTDTARRNSWSVQVIKVWDVLPAKKAGAAAQTIQISVDGFSARKLKFCKYILHDRDLVVPMKWHTGETEEFDCLADEFADLVL